jgi:bisphosphoglycerate-dependent phosphoglycerate mutase
MSETPVVYLARHGETAWTLSGQHTGLTDLPLTDQSERNARHLGHELRGRQFARIFTSPCSARHGPVNLPASAPNPKSIAILWNGTMANTRVSGG